jgi:sulfur carrier protein
MDETMLASIIEINGRRETLPGSTLSALLEHKGIDPNARGVAVALNGAVVPRAAWAATPVRPGDAVEIVRAMQGG